MTTTSECCICLELLSTASLGVCVPCGHCLHEDCFRRWEASRTGRAFHCPMCKVKCRTFNKVYIDFQKEEDASDDDISLSSLESSVDENDEDEEDDDNDDDKDKDENKEKDSQEENESKAQMDDGQEEQREQRRDDVIEIDIDSNSVIEVLSNPPTPQQQPKQTQRSGDCRDDDCRMRRIAKRLKKENKRFKAQRKEHVEKEQKLLEDMRKLRERLETMENEMGTLEESETTCRLDLKEARLDKARLERQLSEREKQRLIMIKRAEKAERDIWMVKEQHKNDLRKHDAVGKQEFEEMRLSHEKLARENSALKEELESLKKNGAKGKTEWNTNDSSRAKKDAMETLKAFTAGIEEAKEKDYQQHEDVRAEPAQQVSKRYGGQAARALRASNAPRKANAMSILDSATEKSQKSKSTLKLGTSLNFKKNNGKRRRTDGRKPPTMGNGMASVPRPLGAVRRKTGDIRSMLSNSRN